MVRLVRPYVMRYGVQGGSPRCDKSEQCHRRHQPKCVWHKLALWVRACPVAYQLCSSPLGFQQFSSRGEKQKSILIKPLRSGKTWRECGSGHAWASKQHAGSGETQVNTLTAAACEQPLTLPTPLRPHAPAAHTALPLQCLRCFFPLYRYPG